MRKGQKGFTLIELLVVIAIIGVLAAVVLVSLNSARAKSRDARRLSDVRQIMTALEIYFNDIGSYPASIGAMVPTYIGTVPAPQPGGTCTGTVYTYTVSGTAYTISFCLENTAGGFAPGARSATERGLQ
jgi:prepilin-type N-terminal cleavage/methylation domain-containing protein